MEVGVLGEARLVDRIGAVIQLVAVDVDLDEVRGSDLAVEQAERLIRNAPS